jgi:hypothetical protein
MFPFLLIAIGLAVLAFGSRLAVLGAAVGALFGVALLRLIPGSQNTLLTLGIPVLLAVLGGIGAGFMKGIVGIVTIVMGAVAGAAIVIGFIDLLNLNLGWIDWLLAIVGAMVGIVLVQRFKDWAMYILAGLVGALLVMRGLGILLPVLQGTLGTLLVLVIAGGSVAVQGGLLRGRKPRTNVPAAGGVPVAQSDEITSAASAQQVATDTQVN